MGVWTNTLSCSLPNKNKLQIKIKKFNQGLNHLKVAKTAEHKVLQKFNRNEGAVLVDKTPFPPEITLFERKLQNQSLADGFFVLYEKINKDETTWVKFENITDQITRMIEQITGKGDKVKLKKVSWPSKKAENLAKASKFHLKKIYLIARHQPGTKVKLEYAFWLEIRSSDQRKQNELKRKFPVPLSFHELYLKVWQTTNKKILKGMAPPKSIG